MTGNAYVDFKEDNGYGLLERLNAVKGWFSSIDRLPDGFHADASGVTADGRRAIIEVKTREMRVQEDGSVTHYFTEGSVFPSMMIEGHKLTDLLLDAIDGFLPLYVNFLKDGSVLLFNLSTLSHRPASEKKKIYSKANDSFEVGTRYFLDIRDAIVLKNALQ